MTSLRDLLLLCVLGCSAGWVSGCGKKKRPRPPAARGETVRKIKFDGNGRFGSGRTDFAVRAAMEQGKNPPLTWLVTPRRRRVFLDRETLELDAWRIETWYAHQGFYDAAVQGWDVHHVAKGKKFLFWDPPPRVKITGVVKEGKPTVLKSLDFEGMDIIGKPLLMSLEAEAPLQIDAPFNVDSLHATEALALNKLQERSFAYAQIDTQVDVFPGKHEAEVRLVGTPGPSCKFGEVTIVYLGSGAKDAPVIDPKRIEQELLVNEGDRYSISAMSKTRQRLFGLGVFSVVNVLPELKDPDSDVVPIRVELARANDRQLRVGGGVLIETGKQDVHVSGDFEHVNLFNRLVRLGWENRVGYTTLAQVGDIGTDGVSAITKYSGPTIDSTLTVTIPRFPSRRWTVGTELNFEMGVEQGYKYTSQGLGPSIQGRLTDRLSLDLGYNLVLFQFRDLTLDPSEYSNTALGLDFVERYMLTYLRQGITWDDRNDIFAPTRGQYARYEVAEASRYLGGDFNYVRMKGDHRFYFSLKRLLGKSLRGTLATRLGGGLIQTYGDENYALVPTSERLYLGGSTDVRGWARRHLGPYLYANSNLNRDASALGVAQISDEVIPVGGLVMAHATIEPRIYQGSMGFAAFLDAGMVWSELDQVYEPDKGGLPITLVPTTGVGFRYLLDFAVIRLDVARRLDDEPMFAKESRWGFHFSLSEAF